MDTRRIAVALVALLLFTTAAWAASTAVPVQNDIPVTTNQTPTAILETGSGEDLDITSFFNGDQLNITTPQGDITVSGDDGAEFRLALESIEGEQTEVTGIDAGTQWIELNPADKQRVDVRGDAESLSFKSAVVNDGSTDLQLTGPTDGSAELRIHDLSAGETYGLFDPNRGETLATATADSSGVLQTDVPLPDGSHSLEIRSADAFDAPTVTDLSPTGQITEVPQEISANITVDAAPANVEWVVDGETVNTTTISGSGVYSQSIGEVGLGVTDYSVTVTDQLNQTDSASASFETPSELTVREEHNQTQLVSDGSAELTARFFSAGGDIAIQREISNSTVDMTGLPNSQFVVTAEGPNHYPRTIYIDSIFDQNTMFLLNSTAVPRDNNSALRSRFLYEDVTGQFPRDVTTIEIERAVDVNGDGQSEFRTVAGDFWGASGEFEVILERGVRYRLVLENQETGQRTIAGTHIPSEELTQTVRTSGLVEQAQQGSGVTALAESNGDTIDIAYTDPANATDELQISVESQSGNVLVNESIGGPLGTYSRTVQLNESQAGTDYLVQFDAGDRHRSTVPVGSGSVTLPVAVPGWLLSILMTIAVTFVGALYGPRTALLGSWAMVFVAAGVSMFGWAFGAPSVLAAALIATAFSFADRVRP